MRKHILCAHPSIGISEVIRACNFPGYFHILWHDSGTGCKNNTENEALGNKCTSSVGVGEGSLFPNLWAIQPTAPSRSDSEIRYCCVFSTRVPAVMSRCKTLMHGYTVYLDISHWLMADNVFSMLTDCSWIPAG